MTYEELVELAILCARNARMTTSREVAEELWRMAKEYQAEAAQLGDAPEIDECSHHQRLIRLDRFSRRGALFDFFLAT
jgi:hypothetical protein